MIFMGLTLLVQAVIGFDSAKTAAVSDPSVPVRSYHVSPTGSDHNSGLTDSEPFQSIQRALDLVRPGDTVILHPGIYYGPVTIAARGTADRTITVKADKNERNRVIISSAFRAVREGKVKWHLESKELQLYSIPFSYFPARILYSGTDLLPYPTLNCLETFTLLKGYPGIRHGFFFDAGTNRLYVRLYPDGKYGSSDPNKHLMCISPANAGAFNGTDIVPENGNLTITARGAGYIRLEGLTFETPGAAGVVNYADNVTVANCWFEGCRFGVWGVCYSPGKPEAVIVENNDYHHFPAFDDMKETIKQYRDSAVSRKFRIYWWQRKGLGNDSKVMKNYETGIAGGIGKNWHIRNNLIHDAFEGLSCWGNNYSENLQVYGNKFLRLVDNGLESENHAKNMSIHNNVFCDVFEPISWQPLGGLPWPGPIFVYHNLFYTTREHLNLWPGYRGCFKIGAGDLNWIRKDMGMVPREKRNAPVSKRFAIAPYPGFQVYNNTVYAPDCTLFNAIQPLDREFINFRFFNNIFIVKMMDRRTGFKGSLIEFFNNISVSAENAEQSKIMAGENGIILPDVKAVMFKNTEEYDFSLMPGSPAIGKGTLDFAQPDNSKDIGAIPVDRKAGTE